VLGDQTVAPHLLEQCALAHSMFFDLGEQRIHFRFDIDGSQVSCTQVADYLYDNRMRRSRH
jgi:hypothetical protein